MWFSRQWENGRRNDRMLIRKHFLSIESERIMKPLIKDNKINIMWMDLSAFKRRDRAIIKCFANRYKIYLRDVKDPVTISTNDDVWPKHVIWIKSLVNILCVIAIVFITIPLTSGFYAQTDAEIRENAFWWNIFWIVILICIVWNLLFNLFWKIKISAWKNKDIP